MKNNKVLAKLLANKNLQFILFGGKGGVGKTSSAAATGIYMAKHGKKTLVFSANPSHALSDCFAQQITDKATPIEGIKDLHAMEIDIKKAMDELNLEYRKDYKEIFKEMDESGMDFPFERKIMLDFINFPPPGLDELIALKRLNEFIKTKKYDLVIVDMAASGHCLRLLQLPEIVVEWLDLLLKMYEDYAAVMRLERTRAKTEELKNDISNLRKVFMDPQKTEFIAVMFAEAMVIYETEDLLKGIKACDVSSKNIIINYLLPKLSTKCKYCASRIKQQEKYLKEIYNKFSKYGFVEIPLFLEGAKGTKFLEDFSKALFEAYKPKLPSLKQKVAGIDITKLPRLDLKKELQFILLGGKGGCGKTTSAATTAIYAAKQGKKTLVFSTDPAPSLSDSFAQQIGEKITPIKGVKNLWALEMNSQKLFEKFKKEYKDTIIELIEKSTYTKKEDLVKFFEFSIPGIDEVMAVREIINILKKEEYDLIILDTAPTGHTLRFLELPDLMLTWVKFLTELREKTQFIVESLHGTRLKGKPDKFLKMMKKDTRMIKSMLSDVEQTEFIPVTILEDIPVAETERFVKILSSYSIPVRQIIINKIAASQPGCVFCNSMAFTQLEYAKKFHDKFKDYKIVGLPYLPYEIRGLDKLTEFGKIMFKR